MSLVALGSVKGSPGVTTAAVALGAAWPAERRVLVCELDPAGGDLAGRFRLPAAPSLLTLAAAARHHGTAGLVWRHAQALPGGLPVLTCPADPDQARQGLRAAGLAPALASLDADVLADAGRLDPGSPALGLLDQASLLLLATRPTLDDLEHLAPRLPGLRRAGATALLLVGSGPYTAAEITAALGVEVAGTLPADRQGARLLAGAPCRAWVLRRTRLVRAAASLAARLAQRLPPPRPAPVEAPA